MPPADRPAIPEAELALLKALWERGPSTVRELRAATPARAYTTVQTLLSRLEDKGYVSVDRGGVAHVFAASVSREDLLDQRLDQLASELCDGARVPLVLRLVAGGRFNADDIARFRRMLDEAPGASADQSEADRDAEDPGGPL